MDIEQTRLGENGRIVIPAAFRRALGYKPGEKLNLRIDENGLHIQSLRQALERAQAIIGHLAGPDRSLSAELIADRRREVASEAELE